MLKVLERVRSGDRPPQRCLEVAQGLLLKKHDQLKRETMLLIEAAAVIAGGGAQEQVAPEKPAGGRHIDNKEAKKSTATILVSKNKAKLPLLLKIK